MKHKYSEKQLIDAINGATSIRQALVNLGISPQGGNYKVIHKAINKYNINVSHFLGKGWSKHKSLKPKTDTQSYLQNTIPISSYKLKIRLLKDKLLEPKCSNCKLETWLCVPIPLELDHIDGNNNNNVITNLRLLCPNCHALTPTYRGKNQKRAKA